MFELFNAQSVSRALRSQWLGHRFQLHESVGSTNDILAKLAAAGEREGSIVIANYQISGKGRLGRSWSAPAGSSLLFSVLFRPNWPVEQVQWLTMMAGISAADAINAVTGLDTNLKWPNDIVVNDTYPWRKCGGILVEGDIDGSLLRTAVVGVGINVNIERDELAELAPNATSLQAELGRTIKRLDLLASILLNLEDLYSDAQQGDAPLTRWKSMLVNLGRDVYANFTGSGAALKGTAIDVDDSGRLLVRDSMGNIHRVAAGDVTIVS